MKKFLAVAGLALSLAAPAFAVPITYVLSGNFTGSLGGNSFTTNVVFTGIGDSATAVDQGSYTNVQLSSLRAFADGIDHEVFGSHAFFANENGVSGFQDYSGSDFLDFGAPSLQTYDAVSSRALTGVTLFYTAIFETDAGTAGIEFGENINFSASVAPIPEPATWTLMIGGFGLVGATMRRRAAAA